MSETWTRFEAKYQELADLGRIGSIVGWDQQVTMPPGGAKARGEAMGTLARIGHAKLTDPELGALLDELKGQDLDDTQAAIVDQLTFRRDRAVKVPSELAVELAEASARGFQIWNKAKAADDFASYLPALEKIIELRARQAEAIGYTSEVYETYMDPYERGLKVAEVEQAFTTIADGLRPLLDAVLGSDTKVPSIPDGPYDDDEVMAWCKDVAARLGYDFERGRLDRSAHPFTGGADPGDIRITTRLLPDDPFPAAMATMHEVGHALYEQGSPPELARTPAGGGVSMAVHESQSRLWENCVGRSRAFWEGEAAKAAGHIPALKAMSAEDLYRHANRVGRTLIRVDADELTYPLHIIVRFELELGITRGQLKAADLPQAWNDAYSKHLGVRPPTDREGVLQDVHWSGGAFGYFPTYLLGSAYAAALFEAAGDHTESIRKGDFSPVLDWLRSNLHRHASTGLPKQIMSRALGTDADAPIDVEPYLRSLRTKFEDLYDVKVPA